jgi:Na+-transporting NADH:ubiquinone oxidoreductase subunit A
VKTQVHYIRRGLDVPVTNAPDTSRTEDKKVRRVAVLGEDSHGLRARLSVERGQRVHKGDLLFEDAKNRGVRYTAPGSGVIRGIHRGERRRLLSVVIDLDDTDENGRGSSARFEASRDGSPQELLLESGLWTALRMRPYSKVASPKQQPHSIFVTAIDTHPLAAPVRPIIEAYARDFEIGLSALLRLREVPVFLCKAAGDTIPLPRHDRLHVADFSGPHPAGLPGTHIHMLDPVYRSKLVWWIHHQDVIALGGLVDKGELFLGRTVSLAGPSVQSPRLIRTRVGASIEELVAGELVDGEHRVVSGSVLAGRKAAGPQTSFLGRYHTQVSALPEGRSRGRFWPGDVRFPGSLFSRLGGSRRTFDTWAHGPSRPMPPVEAFESVMPLDLLPVPLLRSLAASNPVQAEELGCLELDEEDVALCTYVDPGKTDWGRELRNMLTLIEREG